MPATIISLLSVLVFFTGGCATKQFVQEEIARSEARVNTQISDNHAKVNTQISDNNAKIDTRINRIKETISQLKEKISQIKEKTGEMDESLEIFRKESSEFKEVFIKSLEIEHDLLQNKLTHVEKTLKMFKGSKGQESVAPPSVDEPTDDIKDE